MVQTVLTIQRMRSMFINIHSDSSREMRKLPWHVKHYKHSSKRSKTQATVHQRKKMKKKKRNSWGQWRGKSTSKSTIFISGMRMITFLITNLTQWAVFSKRSKYLSLRSVMNFGHSKIFLDQLSAESVQGQKAQVIQMSRSKMNKWSSRISMQLGLDCT